MAQDQMHNDKEALLRGNSSSYGSNDNKNDSYAWRTRPPSLSDTDLNRFHTNPRPSRLEWAQSSCFRWIHVLFWWWLNPLLSLGQKQTLTDDDLDDLPHDDRCSVLFKKLLIYDWSIATTWRIILRAFAKETFFIGLILLPHTAARLAQPLFIRAIVDHISQKEHISVHMNAGILLAIGFFLSSILQALLYQHALFLSTKLGIRIRNALSSTIYQHLLSISMSSLQQISAAQTINLIANDASKFEEFWFYGHFLWAAPLEAIVGFGLLSWIIGLLPTCFAFIVLLFLVPLQLVFSKYFTQYRKKTIVCTDKRIKTYSELLDACQTVKMYSWEKPMKERVYKLREDEMESIQHASHLRAFNKAVFFISPCMIALVAFGGLWSLGFQLTPADVFTALAFFGQIRLTFTNLMPIAIERLSSMLIASKRIDEFMRLKTIQSSKRQLLESNEPSRGSKSGAVVMQDASFTWGDNNTSLSSLSIDIKPGQLVGVFGSVGSGKSSLLAAILGEMNLISGNIQVNGRLSYALQSAWIFADTIRANILLGKKFDQERYERVLHACCLDVDLKAFGTAGDLTIIGDKGINLSGGQKARVSLARALYVNADIYLLDDPLSPVDSKVAKRIFDTCIGPEGILKDKTRVLVTHQTHFLVSSDQCFLLDNGRIKKTGAFTHLSIEYEHMFRPTTNTKTEEQADEMEEITSAELDLSKSISDTKSILHDEISITAGASWSVWCSLFTASPLAWFGFILLIVSLLSGEILYDTSTYWLAIWSRKSYIVQQHVLSYAYIYFGLATGTIIIGILRADYWFYIMLCGSSRLHNRMLHSILYTSTRFFESNSTGRILHRASRDQYLIDELLPMALFEMVQASLILAGSLTIIILVNPLTIILLIVVIPICGYLRHYYAHPNHQFKRLENATRSPVLALFSSSLNGLSTIRAFKVKDNFLQTFVNRIDANTRAYIPLLGGIHWFGLRLDFIAATFVLMVATLSVITGHKMDASMVALSLTCSLNLVGRLQYSMRQLSEAENLMISAERIDEYTRLPPEEDNGGGEGLIQPPSDWPSCGSIEFRNYTLRYRPELEPVLNNLNLIIERNEKIGIIGRTGAGKSSVFQGIFRLVKRSAVNGEILIDGIDISRVKLDRLRSHLSIIPQIPVLFSGTLRYNLDPSGIYTDQQCFDALDAVQLKHRVCNHPDGLYLSVAEYGSNFSVGECQLICIARAILKKSKILLIDEATANVDQQTDALIQAAMSERFCDRTILTIAHRLNTIAHSDRILVMERGRIANVDIPKNILDQQ